MDSAEGFDLWHRPTQANEGVRHRKCNMISVPHPSIY